ncbi:hypothetical protein K1719_017745 [Acacia pycnantha]|nr:hypothetical protein K1719_017745 [Acacia pycnantha]
MVIVLREDFRQILLVIPRGYREDILFTANNALYLWKYCKIFILTKNMCLESSPSCEDSGAIQEFGDWIVSIRDGSVPTFDEINELISIPDEFMLHPTSDPLECIVENTYPALLDHLNDKTNFMDHAILTCTLSIVDEVNNYVLGMLPEEEKLYLSEDSVSKQDRLNSSMANLHSTGLLNTLLMPGLPNHRLKLKVGIPIMLMCNIDKSIRLFNGTQLIVTRLEKHIIGADIMSGDGIGTKVLIPRTTIHHQMHHCHSLYVIDNLDNSLICNDHQ